MQAGVHAHQPVAPLPVDDGLDDRAGLEALGRCPLGRNVQDTVGTCPFDRIGDHNVATSDAQPARIAWLPATGGVENRAVELDAFRRDGHDRGLAGFGVGIVAEDELPSWRGTQLSSQVGVGRPRSRKNAGLNSFL